MFVSSQSASWLLVHPCFGAVGTHPTGMFSSFITGFVQHISILQFVPNSETGQSTADAMIKRRSWTWIRPATKWFFYSGPSVVVDVVGEAGWCNTTAVPTQLLYRSYIWTTLQLTLVRATPPRSKGLFIQSFNRTGTRTGTGKNLMSKFSHWNGSCTCI